MSAPERSARERLEHLRAAFAQLTAFVASPILEDRDRAGIIQAFEFTFELFWKTFQSLAQAEGIEAAGPKRALKAAFELGFINDEDEWLTILDDRNLTAHAYNAMLAQAICDRIIASHMAAFRAALVQAERAVAGEGS